MVCKINFINVMFLIEISCLGNYVQIIRNIEGHPVAEVGQSNRKDVRNAVEVAIKAQPGWEKRSGFNKAQILRYIGKDKRNISYLTEVH